MTEAWAPASIQVIGEAWHDLSVDTRWGNTSFISPIKEVFCGADMSSG
jgi:hypothetical protein